jgi:hypothetical protein
MRQATQDPLGAADDIIRGSTRSEAEQVRAIIRASRRMSEAIRAIVTNKYQDPRDLRDILKDLLADYDYTTKGRVR